MNGLGVFLAYTEADQWRLGIGDPTVGGWLTVFAYFLTSALAWRVSWQRSGRSGNRERVFWVMLAGMLVLLGVNKQLDLQTWFTLTGKRVAQAQGWYESRRVAQGFFILCLGIASLAGFIFAWRLVRGRARQLWLPLAGFTLLLCFVVVRAASFHHVDQLLRFRILGLKMNWIFELGAIATVAVGAWRNIHSAPPPERRASMRTRIA